MKPMAIQSKQEMKSCPSMGRNQAILLAKKKALLGMERLKGGSSQPTRIGSLLKERIKMMYRRQHGGPGNPCSEGRPKKKGTRPTN